MDGAKRHRPRSGQASSLSYTLVVARDGIAQARMHQRLESHAKSVHKKILHGLYANYSQCFNTSDFGRTTSTISWKILCNGGQDVYRASKA
jgi:hypothetical protein